MRCKHCYRAIYLGFSMWRLRSTDSLYCYASRTGYHDI